LPIIPSTSAIAAGYSVQGLQIQVGFGSPPQYTTVCNASDYTIPFAAEVADVTNVGDQWRARVSTLLDMGKMKFKVFWVMTEPTHENQVNGIVYGLRYIYINRLLASWKFIYPDGNNSADTFQAYVTGFSTSGKVGGVFEAEIELTASVLGSTVPVLV
jgi:hypothetical protein